MSQPSAACSGGLAAATTTDVRPAASGHRLSARAPRAAGPPEPPAGRWRSRRGTAPRCQRGQPPRPARRGEMDRGAILRRRSGGPAKSEGSRMLAITVSQASPAASAISRTAELFPGPRRPTAAQEPARHRDGQRRPHRVTHQPHAFTVQRGNARAARRDGKHERPPGYLEAGRSSPRRCPRTAGRRRGRRRHSSGRRLQRTAR